jgi:phage baseplate assembly protein W
VHPDIVFEVGDPLPGGAAPAADMLGRLYGVDLRFELDYFVMGSGDLERTQGLEALKASFARSLVTTPGEIFWRPTFGIGITDFLNQRPTAAMIHEVKNRIRSTLLSDPAVEEVSKLDVIASADGSFQVHVTVRIAGQVQPIALGIRRP